MPSHFRPGLLLAPLGALADYQAMIDMKNLNLVFGGHGGA
jgi:hypothetical protein